MKKALLILAVLFLSADASAQSYNVIEHSMLDETECISVYEFKEDGIFLLNGTYGEYMSCGFAYTENETMGDVVLFIKNYLTILGYRIFIKKSGTYNVYSIYGLLKQS